MSRIGRLPIEIPVQPFDPVGGVNHPPDFPLVLEVGEIEPVPVMAISFQHGITLLPPGNKLFKFLECLFRGDLPLVWSTDLFKFFHDLFLVPGLDFPSDIPLQVYGT